jgi:hypothetical protein
MTEAIAFLFSYYTPKENIAPNPEEFFTYVRNLSIQTYHILVPGPRRRVSNRLLGSSGGIPFSNNFELLDSIEPLQGPRSLVNSIVQAHAIGMRALTVYSAFVEDYTDDILRSHIAEPFIWYSGLLYHDLLKFRECGLGLSLTFIKDGITFIGSHLSKMRLHNLYETYDKFNERRGASFELLTKYLTVALD